MLQIEGAGPPPEGRGLLLRAGSSASPWQAERISLLSRALEPEPLLPRQSQGFREVQGEERRVLTKTLDPCCGVSDDGGKARSWGGSASVRNHEEG